MGAAPDPEVDGAATNPAGISSFNSAIYQLVRVDGNGTLVPATDHAVVEVEHLLESDKSELPSNEAMRCTHGCAYEGLSFKNSDFVGLYSSEKNEVDSCRLDAGLEEDRLPLSCESHDHSPRFMDVDGQSPDLPNPSQACIAKLQPDSTVQAAPNSPGLNGSHNAHNGSGEIFSNLENEAVTSRSSQPEFSILQGEICLDDLSIRELQEAFRAAFGRHTSVKDKLWLKRRIAMGLINSCDIPTTRFVIKENKILHKEVKEAPCTMNMSEITFLSYQQDSPTNTTDQVEGHIEDHQVDHGKRPSEPLMEHDTKDGSLQMEHCVGKRVRKPTRRYIEELSDIDTRECTGRSISSVRSAGLDQSSSKSSPVRPISDIGSWDTTFVTRQHSSGGSNVQIPHASRLRRSRPRKDFMAFTNFVNMGRGKSDLETSSSEDVGLDHGKIHSAGDKSDNSTDLVPAFKVCAIRRKHHRAWTLSEVLKLVEGVARYGVGRWSEIRRLSFGSYPYRTSVDLKDKWRNLLRASFALGSIQKSSRSSGNHASIPIPRSILLRVRELAEMQSQPLIEFGHARYSGDGGRTVQERSGFL